MCVPAVCVLYLLVFLRAFCRALKILWSPGGVLFPGLISSALSRAESAETGRSGLGDGGTDGGFVAREGNFSTAVIEISSFPISDVISGSAGDGDGEETREGEPEMTQLGGRGGETLGGLVIASSWLETGKVGFSISGGISLVKIGISGGGLSGMRGGGRLKAKDSRVVEVGDISTSAL